MRGLFITFEGSEGCGKSTQSKLLYQYLRRKGKQAIYLREPGGTKISEKIRKILLDPHSHISAVSEMLLYMAARAELVHEIIIPALLSGKIIICDRFLDSTIVYQGFGLGIDIGIINEIGKLATSGIRPDLTILLDLPVKKGLEYRKLNKDRIESRSFAYHNRVRQGYLTLARLEPKRIKVVAIEKDKSVTQHKIRKLVSDLIKN
jgi:dTMP kinase